jgi:hypothetical protein
VDGRAACPTCRLSLPLFDFLVLSSSPFPLSLVTSAAQIDHELPLRNEGREYDWVVCDHAAVCSWGKVKNIKREVFDMSLLYRPLECEFWVDVETLESYGAGFFTEKGSG